jgi:hypothetical protein
LDSFMFLSPPPRSVCLSPPLLFIFLSLGPHAQVPRLLPAISFLGTPPTFSFSRFPQRLQLGISTSRRWFMDGVGGAARGGL